MLRVGPRRGVPVNIDEFYNAVPARRGAWELDFGSDWRDAQSQRWVLGWISATGELYAMSAPLPRNLGNLRFPGSVRSKELRVYVLARVPTEEDARTLLRSAEGLHGRIGGVEQLLDVLAEWVQLGRASVADIVL